MSKELEHIQESLGKASAACRVLQAAFSIMIICTGIGGAVLLALVIAAIAGLPFPHFTQQLNLQSALLLAISLALWLALFSVARIIVKDVAQHKNPFTLDHARKIRTLGGFLIAEVCLSFIIPPAFAAIGNVGMVNIGYVSSATASYPVVPIDLGGLLAAFICFALAQVWRYGALLQSEADETF